MAEEEQVETKWFKRFLTLFLVGFFIIFLGMVLLTAAMLLSGTGTASVGGVIFIWFFPIVFGVGPEAHWLILFAIILAILGIIVLFAMRRVVEKSS